MADDKLDASSKIVRDDRWGSDLNDWQLISSSANSNSGPGVKTYMKSYPGMNHIHDVSDMGIFWTVICSLHNRYVIFYRPVFTIEICA